VLFFELFPLFMTIVSAVIAAVLYVQHCHAPDDATQRQERQRTAEERRARAPHLPPERGGRRPSMGA
jgi:hypothetical protein